MPHADGVFLRDHPQRLVVEGSVADIPFVLGQSLSCLFYPDLH